MEWELMTGLKEFLLVCIIILVSFWQGYHNSVIQLLCSHNNPFAMRDKGQPQHQEHTTLVKQCVGSFVSCTVVNTEELPDRSYGLSSLSEKTRESNHLHI